MQGATSVLLTFALVFGATNLPAQEHSTAPQRLLPAGANLAAVVKTNEIRTALAESGRVRFLMSNGTVRRADIAQMWIASQVDLASPGSGFQVQLLRHESNISLLDMAKRQRPPALVEDLGSYSAFRNSSGYITQLGPKLLAIRQPAQRQATVRWLQTSVESADGSGLKPYLKKALATPGHVVIALDMTDMLSPRSIELRLQGSRRFEGRKELISEMAKHLEHLAGVRFTAKVGDKINAQLHIDFTQDVKVDAGLFKPVLIELFDDLGIPVIGLEEATASARGKSVTLTGVVSDAECSRLISLVIPSPANRAPRAAKREPLKPGEVDTKLTIAYFSQVEKILDTVDTMRKRGRKFSRSATWLEVYARQIEDLPTDGVENDLINFGSSASRRLRELAGSLWGTISDVKAGERSLVYRYRVRPGHYVYHPYYGFLWRRRYVYVTSNLQDVRTKQATAAAQGERERVKIWQELMTERAMIRRKYHPVGDQK